MSLSRENVGPSNRSSALATLSEDSISYEELEVVREKSYRNGGWRRLTGLERALYKASLDLARLRGRIVNRSLIRLLKGMMDRMLRSFSGIVLKLGLKKAGELKQLYERNGMFSCYPSLKRLLEDRGYVLWLGRMEVLLKNVGIV